MLPVPARLRRGLLAAVLAAGVLVVPLTTADVATAAPCPASPLPCLAVPAATTPTGVTGTRQVGKVITATAPVWDQDGVTTTYQWMRDGEDVDGATSASYPLSGDDYDTTVVVRATGTNSAGVTGTSDSAPVEPALGEAIVASKDPVVTGSAVAGGTLTTTTGTWPGTPEPTYGYQWYRSRPTGSGSQAIAGATTATYSPVKADAGRKIVALVVADRVGYAKGTAISNVSTVPKTSSGVTLFLAASTVRRTQQTAVRVVLSSGAGIVPTGRVGVFDANRRIRTVYLGVGAGGSFVFKIPRLPVGTHRLTARYEGDSAHRTSISPVKVLTVTT